MNFGGTGFPFLQDNGISQNRDSWTPVTPGKPIPQRSDLIPVEMQGNQVVRESWNDLLGVYSDILQQGPCLNTAAHNSNPSGSLDPNGGSHRSNAGMVQNRVNQNSNFVQSQNGGIWNGNLGLSQNGGIQNGNMVFGQNGGVRNVDVGMSQNGGVRNVNAGMSHNVQVQNVNAGVSHNGGVRNVNVGVGNNGGVRNVNVGVGNNGGVRNVNVGVGNNGGVRNVNVGMGHDRGVQNIHAGIVGAGQNARVQDWNVGVNQNEGNYNGNVSLGNNLNMGMGQITGNRNWNVGTSQNSGNQNSKVATTPQRIPSQNGYSSSNTRSTLPNDPSNWSPGLLAALDKAKNQATASAAAMNRAMQTSFQAKSRPSVPYSSTQVGSNWPGSEFSSSMLREQDQMFSSSQEVRGYDLQQLPIDGFPDAFRPIYNLNSPPRTEADATSSIANFSQFEPITPDKGKLLENHHIPQEANCSVYGSSSQEKDGQEQLGVSTTSENNENHSNEMLQSIVNSSSPAVSTTLILDAFDEGHERCIDLNKTPQQKTPRRKKHRPKVVREGKPKKTPKPKAQEKGIVNETPSGKRKNARKNGLKITENQQPNDVGQVCAESPQGVAKRKYVRKKSLKTPENQQESGLDCARVPATEPTTKSCRRALSFDLESTQNEENQIEKNQGNIGGFNLNVNPQDTEQSSGINSISKASAVQLEENNGYIAGPKDLQTATYQMLLGNSSSVEATAPATPIPKMKAHALNVIARNVTMMNSVSSQNAPLNGYNQVDRHATGGLGQIAINADAGCTNLDRGRARMLQSASQLFVEDRPIVDGKRGMKRQSFEQMYPHTLNSMHPPFMYQKMLREAIESGNGSDHFNSSCLESNKKKKMQDEVYANISNSPSGITSVNDNPGQERREINGVQANRSVSQLLNAYFMGENATDKVTNGVGLANGNGFFHPMSANQNLHKHHVGSEQQSFAEKLAMKRAQEIRARDAYLFKQQLTVKQSSSNRWLHVSDQILHQEYNNAVEGRQHHPTTSKESPRSDYLQNIRTCQANMSEHKQGQNSSSGNQRGIDKMLQQQQKYVAEGHQQSLRKARGMPKKQSYLGSVDEITYRLEGLNISGDHKNQHALVPYNADNSIVLFEPKKRKPRPRVDLDPETDRLWKLLMGKEGSEGAEAIDKDKEKWWEEERAVFRGRADSFIARMHLVQGDRRFSRWKGSVVDSVIGVFLTQNVSDHLSSSAFMSLAAKFPPNPTSTNEVCCQSETQVLVEEPDIQILEQISSIKYHEKIGRQPLYNHNSIIACESTENKRLTEEELVSQDSFDSVVFQTADEQRSSSGSNSEAEDQTTGSKPINTGSTLMNLLHPDKDSLLQGFYDHISGSSTLEQRTTNLSRQSEIQECNRQNLGYGGGNNLKSSPAFSSSINSNIHHMQELHYSPNHFQLNMTPDSQKLGVRYGAMSAEENLFSMPSTASGVTDAYHTSNRTYHQSEMQIPQAQTFVKYGFLSKHPTHRGAFQPGQRIGSGQNSMNNHQPLNSKTHQVERAFMREPVDPVETLNKRESDARKQGSINPKFKGTNPNTDDRMSVVDKQNCVENTAVEANSKEQTCSSREPLGATATNNMQTKKGKTENEKKSAFDWDSLRKQVLLNGGIKERSKDAVDSLNYEALRSADVKKISDAIRERGMNNMLAERIQAFLNRLVRDHESIDLEWLRDVPPDKAKDYLLSVRGLGLKSVECVRLLTLHHLAFPVDTNVGRIAVRLGWVPLQPLPESLQLHLLEMYPVLESIQKYLWPRLCKLDQPTLYELHYQMITFGKVFCTKSKPNCNACPMKGECRHFASAFASARFALPGPEEKRMTSSAIPIVDDRTPKEAIKPLSLPPAENNSHKDSRFFDQKSVSIIEEPIVEYPSSPHSETTISERDIEDAFYEDPDEIPTIRLNMEEFTTNLQNLMQDNMELQGDMSKALVALSSEAASIPTPKLKNVSRLRTEHRVYELPDSHPLLDGLDKREPDDPSPYLLAIWTPGETANSVQPHESTCSAQETGRLCDDNTCFSCNSTREANSQTVRGTILVPCRTAMRGSFPLNGTYFQVNEMFADHESSLRPIDVPRTWLWNLPRRTVFFGTSVSTIFKGLTTEEIQLCFWRGFVCVRGFDQKSRAPRPLMARLHFPASKLVKKKDEGK